MKAVEKLVSQDERGGVMGLRTLLATTVPQVEHEIAEKAKMAEGGWGEEVGRSKMGLERRGQHLCSTSIVAARRIVSRAT
jgi:hypothetical protein